MRAAAPRAATVDGAKFLRRMGRRQDALKWTLQADKLYLAAMQRKPDDTIVMNNRGLCLSSYAKWTDDDGV